LQRAYLRSALAPWKLATFLPAALFFVIAAPYTGDPTWDHVDGAMMSLATFATAPWALGTLVRARRGKSSWAQIYVATIAWLLSASWSYDGWLFFRDGRYPSTWLANLLASSTLYAAAGMLWSLNHVPGHGPGTGVVLDFQTDAWFERPSGRFARVAVIALLLIAGVSVALLPFVREAFERLR
jgi:hypothetical protein